MFSRDVYIVHYYGQFVEPVSKFNSLQAAQDYIDEVISVGSGAVTRVDFYIESATEQPELGFLICMASAVLVVALIFGLYWWLS